MRFTVSGHYNGPDDWQIQVAVPEGEAVTVQDVIDRWLTPAIGALYPQRAARILTPGELATAQADYAASCALPDGWEDTADGVGVAILLGQGQTYSATFQRTDGAICEAPVADVKRTRLPATREALLAYDAEHPIAAPVAPPPAETAA